MNMIRSACFILLFLISSINCSFAAGDSEPAPLLPESLAARGAMAANQKTTTILLLQDDPRKATAALNASNADFAKRGWTVFAIIPYTDSGDFLGFFITYQKKLILQ